MLSAREAITSLLGLIPFLILLGAVAAIGLVFAGGKLSGEDVSEVMTSVLVILAGVVVVLMFVSGVCMTIHPTEQFRGAASEHNGIRLYPTYIEQFTDAPVDVSSSPLTQLWADIATAEKAVCGYITRADKFIQSDLGKPGHDDPSLVTQAQQDARDKAGGPLTDCESPWDTTEPNVDDATNRVTRLETTLNGFTAPAFQQAFDAQNTCESFVDVPNTAVIQALQQRLSVIQSTIQTQQQKFLKPIDDKTAALNRGEASDCDKKRGATAGGNIAGGKKP